MLSITFFFLAVLFLFEGLSSVFCPNHNCGAGCGHHQKNSSSTGSGLYDYFAYDNIISVSNYVFQSNLHGGITTYVTYTDVRRGTSGTSRDVPIFVQFHKKKPKFVHLVVKNSKFVHFSVKKPKICTLWW